MSKWLKTLLSLNSLRKAYGNELFFNAAKFNFHLEILDSLKIKKALVLAPHPDDDCFGCAGAMSQIMQKQGEVTVAYFCDGSGGIKESEKGRNKELIQIRKKEAKLSGDILGLKEQMFFGYKDGALVASVTAVRAIVSLIKRVQPDIIFIPSFLDNHPDHRAANDILVKALAKIDLPMEIWAFEIWTPLYANRILMINDELELKKQAIEAHKSQLETRGYEQAVLGLNQYRAEINGKNGLAEGYFASSPALYRELYRRLE
jgi:LmbE family N-acetylglucosaminyl deacetylase